MKAVTRGVVGCAVLTSALAFAETVTRGDEPAPRKPILIRPGLRPGAPIGPAAAKKVDVFAVCNRGEQVFTATLAEATVIGQTRSLPPSLLIKLAVKDPVMLKGPTPKELAYRTSQRAGTGCDLIVGKPYLLIANRIMPGQPPRLVEIVPATDAHMKAARQAVALPVGWTLDEKGKPVSPWRQAWPAGAMPAIKDAPRCGRTNRPALLAGTGVTLTVAPVMPKKVQRFRNPQGDGAFKVTVTNSGETAVDVPALLTDGATILWADSLYLIERRGDKVHLLPDAGNVTDRAKPLRLEPGKSVSTVINTLVLKDVTWPKGAWNVGLLFCLGEQCYGSAFYYSAKHHDALRKKAVAGDPPSVAGRLLNHGPAPLGALWEPGGTTVACTRNNRLLWRAKMRFPVGSVIERNASWVVVSADGTTEATLDGATGKMLKIRRLK